METRSSLTSERRRALTAGVLIGAICGSVVLVFDPMLSALTRGAVQPLYSIELKTYDWRLSRIARPETARADIVMVAIDEDSLRALQPQMGRWPWPRVVHAAVIDFLARAPARAVVYDINFAEPDSRVGFRVGDGLMSGAESDREFIAAVRRAGNVYLLADAAFETSTIGRPLPPSSLLAVTGDGLLERKAVFPPLSALRRCRRRPGPFIGSARPRRATAAHGAAHTYGRSRCALTVARSSTRRSEDRPQGRHAGWAQPRGGRSRRPAVVPAGSL